MIERRRDVVEDGSEEVIKQIKATECAGVGLARTLAIIENCNFAEQFVNVIAALEG